MVRTVLDQRKKQCSAMDLHVPVGQSGVNGRDVQLNVDLDNVPVPEPVWREMEKKAEIAKEPVL